MFIKLVKILIKIFKIVEGVEKLVVLDIVGGNINWYKIFWKEFGKMYLEL